MGNLRETRDIYNDQTFLREASHTTTTASDSMFVFDLEALVDDVRRDYLIAQCLLLNRIFVKSVVTGEDCRRFKINLELCDFVREN